MPTTRSQGRSEPLQHLETPPKRQRKQNPRRPSLARLLPKEFPYLRTGSMSPEPMQGSTVPNYTSTATQTCRPSYVNASTQTEDVIILTSTQIAELRDRLSASMNNKRVHDDESEDEPVAKRHQFSTPQSKTNNLWMFGDRVNGDHPRTAPSKSFNAQHGRRPMRGPLAKRTNFSDSPRFRVRTPAASNKRAALDDFQPIERVEKPNNSQEEERERPRPQQSQSTTAQEETHSGRQSAPPQTPRRGLFGSLRGIVNKGWDVAASLTPFGGRTSPNSTPAHTESYTDADQITYPRMDALAESEEPHTSNDHEEMENGPNRRAQPISDTFQSSSQFDHLHYIPADAQSIDRALNGEITPPPRAPTPPSPASRIKAQNPGLDDATIESILKKRERKAAMEESKYGRQPQSEPSKVAPLFGPDSHYARGTVDPRFMPATPLYGPSKKRKLQTVDGKIPGPKNGGFGIDDEWLDVDAEIVSVDIPIDDPFARPSKRSRVQDTEPEPNAVASAPATPRSALKKPGLVGTNGRKSVAFGQSTTRDIRGHYGPAGQYKGSTFADETTPEDDRSLSSIDHGDIISPTTRLNTVANSGRKAASVLDNLGAGIPAIDFTLRDPNDMEWRPSLGNPRPGSFRVPDIDEEDPDDTMSDVTPEQPSTPRLSHAELPAAPSTTGSTSFNESSIVNESTELALDKARSKAERHKPKTSSRLSNVAQARSRSASPDEDEEEHSSDSQADETVTSRSTTSMTEPAGRSPRPFKPRELDDITQGSDGMTDHQREHQYDEWAANLDWDAPQTYENAGTGSGFVHNLIRKNWTEEDSARSEAFWVREFDAMDRAMNDAKKGGHQLVLITGMEGIEGY